MTEISKLLAIYAHGLHKILIKLSILMQWKGHINN